MDIDSDDKNSAFVVNGDTDQQIFRIIFNGTGHKLNGIDLLKDLDSATNINTWYHIELKNIDWTNKTLDFHADNNIETPVSLIGEGFTANSANGIGSLYLVSNELNAKFWLDEIVMY